MKSFIFRLSLYEAAFLLSYFTMIVSTVSIAVCISSSIFSSRFLSDSQYAPDSVLSPDAWQQKSYSSLHTAGSMSRTYQSFQKYPRFLFIKSDQRTVDRKRTCCIGCHKALHRLARNLSDTSPVISPRQPSCFAKCSAIFIMYLRIIIVSSSCGHFS